MSSDEDGLPKISFGSFASSQECKRESGVTGSTGTSTGSEQNRHPTDPRLATNRRQGYRPSPHTINGGQNHAAIAIGEHRRGSGPIRRRGRSHSARARDPVYVVRNQCMHMYVHVYLVPNCYNSYISLHDDDADLITLTLYIFLTEI